MSNADDRIACAGCGRKIVPRLWHYGGGRLTYVRAQHICPFCGVVLYETGGGLRRGCLVGLGVFALLFLTVLVFIVSMRLAREFAR